MKNFKASIIAIIISLTLTSCFPDRPKGFYIDNPTKKTIHVVIDDTIKYEVKPKEYKFALALLQGEHTVQTDGGAKKSFKIRSENDQYNYLLNAAGATYVEVTEVYSLDNATKLIDILYRSKNTLISPDSTSTYYGMFKLKDGVFIEKSWEHDVESKFPKTVDIWEETKVKSVTKLFRLEDFKKEYKDAQVTEEDIKEIEELQKSQKPTTTKH